MGNPVPVNSSSYHDPQSFCRLNKNSTPRLTTKFWASPPAIIPINAQKSDKVTQEAQALYNALQEEGFDVLLDDRNERAGVLFADNELIGIPHRLVISEKLLVNEEVEYKSRHLDEVSMLKKTHVVDFFKKLFALQKA